MSNQKLNARQFCYWLQGYLENKKVEGKIENMSEAQIALLQKRLNSVFVHDIDPSYGDEEHQKDLNAIHNEPNDLVRC